MVVVGIVTALPGSAVGMRIPGAAVAHCVRARSGFVVSILPFCVLGAPGTLLEVGSGSGGGGGEPGHRGAPAAATVGAWDAGRANRA